MRRGFVKGIIAGGLAGAAAGLLLAPKITPEVKASIRGRGRKLRSQTARIIHLAKNGIGDMMHRHA